MNLEFKFVPRSVETDIQEYECSRETYYDEEGGSFKPTEFLPGLVFYRYMDRHWNSTSIGLEKYKAIKETPCGYWILDYNKEKWIPKESRKRFCYPTKEEAWHNFKARKNKQLKIMKSRIEGVECTIDLIKKIEALENDQAL